MSGCEGLPVDIHGGVSGGGENGVPAWQLGVSTRIYGGGKSPVPIAPRRLSGKEPIPSR